MDAGAPGRGPLDPEERVALLLDIARRSSGTLDLERILDRLLDGVATVVRFDAAGIFALAEVVGDRAAQGVHIAGVARRGYLDRPVDEDRMLTLGEGLVGHAIRTGASLLVGDVRRDPRYVVGRAETLSELVVPIVVDGRAIAALDVESDRSDAFDRHDLERLEFFAAAAAMAIEKAILHRRLVELEQIGAQLRLAREVQGRLLPSAPPSLPGWEIAGLCRPSLELGGDLYDHFPLADGRCGFLIGDVAGKGVPAALIMATFRALVRARRDEAGGPAATVAAVDGLLRESAPTRAFVTACLAALDPSRGELAYASCGHPPGLVLRADGSSQEIENCGPALGAFDDARFVERHLALSPGDRLVLFTDGLVEATSPAGEAFGAERVRSTVLAAGADAPAAVIAAELVARAIGFVASPEIADDLTLLVVRRLG